MTDCKHEEIESWSSSIPRFGYDFSVYCESCKEKIGRVWWEETEPLKFDLVSDSPPLEKCFKKNKRDFVSLNSFKEKNK